MKFYNLRDLDKIPQILRLPKDLIFQMKVVSNILPFRANNYVIEDLINWDNIPNDPIFQLTFMQPKMLDPHHFNTMAETLISNATEKEINQVANKIRLELNPHPSGQLSSNVPSINDEPVEGVQHKYKQTCLVFPSQGQTCFSYCTFCFRWPQFIGIKELKFATEKTKKFISYIKEHKEITDILITGGDPMIMNAKTLSAYIDPFLEPEFEHIKNIRIGTKALTYWPYRFTTDKDHEEILKLFEKVSTAKKQLAFMSHINHWKETAHPEVEKAIKNIKSTGAQIRTQTPLLKHINNSPEVWIKMWNEQTRLGMIPYYMFVERDTGPKAYFEVPLVEAFDIYQNAYKNVSGLARTARGPSMSADPGKVVVDGITEINGEKVFVLSFLQAREPDHSKKPFFAKYDEKATWLNHLKPAFGQEKFFFEK